jgi:4-hydroxy 2-oxovalerate aldolase
MPEVAQENSDAKQWVSFVPDLKVMDCTIRDGGLMNNHKFEDDVVKSVYQACIDAGIDYMEIGYKNAKRIFSTDEFGAWRHCSEDDLKRVVGENDSDVKLSAMADAEKSDFRDDIVPCDQSPLDMIRVASYIHQVPLALEMIKDAHDKGYETTINLMAISAVREREVDEALEALSTSEVETLYVVDSFGSLYREQVHFLLDKFLESAKASGKKVGVHAHNNQQLAYANTIEGAIKGATMLDASMAGLGRGAGNCPMELLVGFLHNPKFKLRPIIKCIQEFIEPLRENLQWGPDMGYMITGLLNQHPRNAIEFNEDGDGDVVGFFDRMTGEG